MTDDEAIEQYTQELNSDFDAAARFAKGVWFCFVLAFLLIVLAWCATAVAQTTGSGSLTIETTPAAAGQITPKLTWSTAPAGATCTASGDWTGTKAASGTETLPAVSAPRSYALRCTWPDDSTASLTWIAPTTNTDGSALAKCATATDTGPCLAKYRICRGSSATSLTDCRDHNFPNSTTTPWGGTLTAGTHWFGIKAVTGQGVESAFSNVVSKTTSAGAEWTASVGVKVPSAVTGLAVQ